MAGFVAPEQRTAAILDGGGPGQNVGDVLLVRVVGFAGIAHLRHPSPEFAGKLLAVNGAEVIRLETPGGEPGRRIGPFYQGELAEQDGNPEPIIGLFKE